MPVDPHRLLPDHPLLMLQPQGLSRRRGLQAVSGLAAMLALGLVGCGHLGAPSKLSISEAELQRLLAARFPVEQRLLELFEVRASSPQLRLLPDRNRVSAVLDLQARERIMASQFRGRLDFDSALRWDAAEQAVRLDQVRVQDFVLEPPAAAGGNVVAATGMGRRSSTERVAAGLAERVLEGLLLYRLPADKVAQLDKAGVQPAALTVTRSGLEITFAPKAR